MKNSSPQKYYFINSNSIKKNIFLLEKALSKLTLFHSFSRYFLKRTENKYYKTSIGNIVCPRYV